MTERTLLIVDDSAMARNDITRIASIMNIQVKGTASSAMEALDLYQDMFKRGIPPTIVTMDLTMSGFQTSNLGGMECIEKIREIDDNANILIISALNDLRTAIRAVQKGARGFVFKPFNEEKFKSAITDILNKIG